MGTVVEDCCLPTGASNVLGFSTEKGKEMVQSLLGPFTGSADKMSVEDEKRGGGGRGSQGGVCMPL